MSARSIRELRAVAAPPQTGNWKVLEWSAVEANLKTELPSDYKEFVETYGLGTFDQFLTVFVPGHRNRFVQLEAQVQARLKAQREYRDAWPDDLPFRLFPELGGLLPWGVTADADVCYWQTGSTDPDSWSVVVVAGRDPRWFRYDGPMSAFLAATLRGETRVTVFPSDFPTSSPSFKPLG